MFVTVCAIDEKRYCRGVPSAVPMINALKQNPEQPEFFIVHCCDFSYFIAVTIITSGLMYFVTVLLQLPETIGNKLMMVMVLTSFIFYPVINMLVKRTGKKIIVIISLLLLSIIFWGFIFWGEEPCLRNCRFIF